MNRYQSRTYELPNGGIGYEVVDAETGEVTYRDDAKDSARDAIVRTSRMARQMNNEVMA